MFREAGMLRCLGARRGEEKGRLERGRLKRNAGASELGKTMEREFSPRRKENGRESGMNGHTLSQRG